MIHALRPPFLHRCIASGVLRSRHRNPVPCIIVKEPRDAVPHKPAVTAPVVTETIPVSADVNAALLPALISLHATLLRRHPQRPTDVI